VPIEAGALAHPYGLLVASISTGLTWGPQPLRRH
jgi:hypothetical protein